MIRWALFGLGAAFGGAFAFGVLGLQRAATPSLALAITLFVIAPIISLACFLTATRGKSKTRGRVLLAMAAVLAGAYALEAVLTVSERVAAVRWLDERGASPVDRRTRAEVVTAPLGAGISPVSVVEPKSFLQWLPDGAMRSRLNDRGAELHPLAGLAHRTSVMCNEMGEWISWVSDRHGMNNPDEVWELDSVDVGFVGDAFVNGWCSPREEHFAGLVTEGIAGSVVNLGQSGNGPLLTLASLVEYASALRPRLVLWFYYELNDLDDLDIERRSPLLMGYLDGSTQQRLIERREAIEREVAGYLAEEAHWGPGGRLVVGEMRLVPDLGAVTEFLKLGRMRSALGATYRAPLSPHHDLWSRVLSQANEVVTSWGGRLVMVHLPAARRYESPGGREFAVRQTKRVFEDLDALGIPWIDPTPDFDKHPRSTHLFNPIEGGGRGHYTPEAHRIVAGAVLGGLQDLAWDRGVTTGSVHVPEPDGKDGMK